MLDSQIRYIKGIGEARAEAFAKKGIKTVRDLLYFFPRDYEDRTQYRTAEQCIEGETVCIRAAVFSAVREARIRKGLTIYSVKIGDDTGALTAVWFNNKYVRDAFSPDTEYIFYGKIARSGSGLQIQNPIYERLDSQRFTGRIVPLYPLTEGLSQKIVQSAMENAIELAGTLSEYLPADIRRRYELPEINYAMRNIHFPTDFESYEIARRRFVFEELLTLQLALMFRKSDNTSRDGIVFPDTSGIWSFLDTLPFKPTSAQKRVLTEIESDFKSGIQMNRLLQGDVGSGKTMVAAAAMYCCVKNGMQAAIMAPTEILAQQHMESLSKFFEGSGINVTLLTGGLGAKQKRLALEDIQLGIANVIVGTHAIIQSDVTYDNLGLVIVDEQHRFGVEQRSRLTEKGVNPHVLVMSATPIPRTLALILYGDLSISTIDELPPGRKPVQTFAVGENMRQRIYKFLEKNLSGGSQAYVVCPLIEETESADLKDAQRLAERLQVIFPQYSVGLLHGRMKNKLKDEIMSDFSSGKIRVLVSTTVIEVGVNVPNANIMIIENAERFGLSQLHQLRGRVGRGTEQAFCIMFAHGKADITRERMKTMCASNDGFYISEQDLKLRGPGDFFGTRQHGLPEMKIANLFTDRDILKDAQSAVLYIKERGFGSEEYAELKARVDKILENDTMLN